MRHLSKSKKVWFSLYRAVDSDGQTLEFLLSPTRDAEAAKCFFCKASHITAGCVPQRDPVKDLVIQPTTPIPRVIAALHTCQPVLGANALALLQGPRPPDDPAIRKTWC